MSSLIVYKDGKKHNNSWIKYFLRRIAKNKNNLIVVVGATGSGKTWVAISVSEMMSKENGVPFTVDNIVFTLSDVMQFINSDKATKGACMIFDEPQVTISSREFMSHANKVFNYLLTTFRHKNLTLFFCTPYEDLLDKTSRKLFHTKFETVKINFTKKTCKIKPKIIEYNSQRQKFYEKFLRISSKSRSGKNTTKKLRSWNIPKPSKELIEDYEKKKLDFTTNLNTNIQKKLFKLEGHSFKEDIRDMPSTKQIEALQLMYKHKEIEKVAKKLDISSKSLYNRLRIAKERGWTPELWKQYEESVANI